MNDSPQLPDNQPVEPTVVARVANPLRSRWLRFSLRTLFVLVTVFACALGYEMHWIRQRRQVIASPRVQTWRYYLGVEIYGNPPRRHQRRIYVPAPWPLDWLGEPGYWAIGLAPGTSETEIERVRRLFPEVEGVAVVQQ